MRQAFIIFSFFLLVCYNAHSQERYPFTRYRFDQFSADFKKDSIGKMYLRNKYVRYDPYKGKTYINDSIYNGLNENKLLSILGRPNWISDPGKLISRAKMSDSIHVLNYSTGDGSWVSFTIKNSIVTNTGGGIK